MVLTMASEQVIKLAERIREEFGIPVNPERFYRTYAGYLQRAAGAFSWVMYCDNLGMVGGCEPIRKYITKKNKLAMSKDRFNEFEIFAYSPDEIGYDRLKGGEG